MHASSDIRCHLERSLASLTPICSVCSTSSMLIDLSCPIGLSDLPAVVKIAITMCRSRIFGRTQKNTKTQVMWNHHTVLYASGVYGPWSFDQAYPSGPDQSKGCGLADMR